MNLKLYIFLMLMMADDDTFRNAVIILECQNYLHRVDVPEGVDRFDKAVAVIQLSEKMGGLGAVRTALERAVKMEK